jgi:Flp pilus assembly protein TadD
MLPCAALGAAFSTDLSGADPDVQSFRSIDNASLALYAGQNALQNGRYEEALEQYTLATEADPSWLAPWYLKAYSLTKLNRYEEALVAVDRALAIDPDDRDSNDLKAGILEYLGRTGEAAKYRRTPAVQPATLTAAGPATTTKRTPVSPAVTVAGLGCLVVVAGVRSRRCGCRATPAGKP